MIKCLTNSKKLMCLIFLFLMIASNVIGAEKELVVVFSGDTMGYVEPCG